MVPQKQNFIGIVNALVLLPEACTEACAEVFLLSFIAFEVRGAV
jgi:hypothetical protein